MGQEFGVSDDNLQESEQFKKKLIEKFNEIAKNKKFNGLEKVRGIIVNTEDW